MVSKIELLIKNKTSLGNTKILYENCTLITTGNFIIITVNHDDSSTINNIYNLNEIQSYKIHNKQIN